MILNENFLQMEARKRNISISNRHTIINANEALFENAGVKFYDIFLSHSYLGRVSKLLLEIKMEERKLPEIYD